VSGLGPDTVLATFLMFCRIGSCIMLMPGFSSPRVPVQARLFIALGVTLALSPVVSSDVTAALGDGSPIVLGRLLVGETVIGAMIGLLARFFLLGLETLAMAIAMAIGLGNILGGPALEEADSVPPIATMITFTATILIFLTDLHWEVLRGLAASYAALPVAGGLRAPFALAQVGDGLGAAFLLALRISSPFIIFAIVVNLAVGILNKLTPQIPVFFISTPFVIAGGLIILYFTSSQLLQAFIAGFSGWLRSG
jgi:flagellar biosynthetic protein FliR